MDFFAGRQGSAFYDQSYAVTTTAFDSTVNQTVNIKYDSNNAGASAFTSETIKVIKL